MKSEDHNLRIFKILYTIKGILTLVLSILPLLYIIFGFYLFQDDNIQNDHSTFGGAIVMSIGLILFIFFIAMGILTLFTAKYLGERRNYDFVFVMAIINCLTGVLGIILGIFTIIELNKPNVKRLFGKPT